MQESLYCIIINWNLINDTQECIDSLIAAGIKPQQMIVIDNGSTDGSCAILRERYGRDIHLIENKTNLGFVAASNQGMRTALDLNAEWVFIINNDTIVSPTILTEFDRASKDFPQIDIFAPLIFEYQTRDRIWNLGDRRLPFSLITLRLGRGKLYKGQFPNIMPVDFVSGCGMVVNKAVIEKIGGFNPKYTMYGEDVDFCWRAHLAGFNMACVTQAHIWHKVSVSARKVPIQTRFLRTRNQIYFYRTYAKGIQKPIMLLFNSLRTLVTGLGDLINRQPQLFAPLIKGWYQGWFVSMKAQE